MNRPETKYAKSGNVRIAYQVTGEGPIDMVWAPGTVSHLDMAWERPASAQSIERFSSFCRLIRFDKRGTGLSDRPPGVSTLEKEDRRHKSGHGRCRQQARRNIRI